ncbi:PAR1 protein [Forsythia ovata]|uniref:PAR1 protein n=1 Tax=Forsythia ovata TaxID=205694 RepID=A0ABD1T731_9LAMI
MHVSSAGKSLHSIPNIIKPQEKSTFPKQKSSFCTKMKMIVFLAFALFLQGSLGELLCEELPVGLCSFSIASSGKRCLLETFATNNGNLEFQCKTSEVVAINLHEYIEADECVSSCGVDRKSIGISSDSLLDSQFTAKLCSPQCYQNCPNIVDLYYNLALGEGAFLPDLCKSQRTSLRRSMAQIQSSGAALGPVSTAAGPMSAAAPAPASSGSSSPVDCAPAPM